jgi:hypothetical protein
MTDPSSANDVMEKAWYSTSIGDFLKMDCDTIVGRLAKNSDFPVLPAQRDAWIEEIRFLQARLDGMTGMTGFLLMEFSIPRMGRRIDAVLLVGPLIIVVEFKVGASAFERAALDQVWDYGLDLKNFHEASHTATIVPLLLATRADFSPPVEWKVDADKVYRPISICPADFRQTIDRILQTEVGDKIDPVSWARAAYRPTPTIVEAARALYAQHTVDAITRSDAGAQNLAITSDRIGQLLDEARLHRRKAICFVTGVPGAGKTLVGLDLATKRRDTNQPVHAVFLSGNGPLVAVLREALTRDELQRQKERGSRERKGVIGGRVKTFIQNVHHFRDDLLTDNEPPAEHVVIFDEAQRAWNCSKPPNLCNKKRSVPVSCIRSRNS